MSAFVAIIRPGCASLLQDFIDRKPYTTGVPELDEILVEGNHRMIYQELIMKYLIWLGIPETGSYDIIKKIAKKKFKEEELSELRKQLETTIVQNEGLKIITPNKEKRQKIKNALQHAYVMELIKKRNDALEEFEVQKATGKETDQQFKQAQSRYGYIDDCLKAKLDELNLSEKDILNMDSASLSRMEEMESAEARLIELNKHISAAQEKLAQTQKQISDACKLLPQEEKLQEEHRKLLSQINEFDQDIKNIDAHLWMPAIELQSLGFINIHHVNMFTSHSYIIIILIGIIITTSLLSLLILVIELARPKAKAQAVTKQ